MKITIQTCWNGHRLMFRALVCGGVLLTTEDGKWRRSDATRMLDLLEMNGLDRRKIRFVHV